MTVKKILISIFVSLISLLCFPPSHSYAYVDDAKVLSGLDISATKADEFLNTNGFSYIGRAGYNPHWSNERQYHGYDVYSSQDGSIITCWIEDRNQLFNIYLTKPGPKTDKGIEVGMSVVDIENRYGKIFTVQEVKSRRYTDKNFSVFNFKNAGEYLDFPPPTGNYTGYQEIEFVSSSNEGLSFIINKHTGKIVLIRYKLNRKGSTYAYQDVYEEFPIKLLPELK